MKQPAYFVYTPKFHRLPETIGNGMHLHKVEMGEGQKLVSMSQDDAMKEAKALGHRYPIVGTELVEAV